jgi:uncharacterized Zn-finger protein
MKHMEPMEVIEVQSSTASCDGGGALGHPRVALTLARDGKVDCPYCGRRFVAKAGAKVQAGH